jgi:hypothetical protein
MYTRKDLAVLWYVAGLLTGLIVGFTSCAPDPNPNTAFTAQEGL